MNSLSTLINSDGRLDLAMLESLQRKPEPFTPSGAVFWDDPHISSFLLETHLDPTIDRASRRPEIVDASVAWIVDTLSLQTGDTILDLGCGPGLYATRLALRGLSVTGVDYSRRSIAYASGFAEEFGLDITYRCENYLQLTDDAQYDAVLLIFGDYCTFNPDQRRQILSNVHRALKPGGHFVVDVSTRLHREKYGAKKSWTISQEGFWRPGPHLVLEQGFDYPESKIYLDQYAVIEEDGKVTVYRNWFQDYDREMIERELTMGGFNVQGVWRDLIGTAYSDDSEWIGIVVEKVMEMD